jgi:hypothetical protein
MSAPATQDPAGHVEAAVRLGASSDLLGLEKPLVRIEKNAKDLKARFNEIFQ